MSGEHHLVHVALRMARVPKRYEGKATLDALGALHPLAASDIRKAVLQRRSIFISGPNGVGKTFAGFAAIEALARSAIGAYCAMHRLEESRVLALRGTDGIDVLRRAGLSYLFLKAADAVERYAETAFDRRAETEDFRQRLLAANAVLLDDIQDVRQTDAGLQALCRIVDARYNDEGITIITSCAPLGWWRKRDSSLASRLSSYAQVVIEGSDLRALEGGSL